MYCGNCGREISDDANVCGYCGTPTGSQDVDNFDGEVSAGAGKKWLIIFFLVFFVLAAVAIAWFVYSRSQTRSQTKMIVGEWRIDSATAAGEETVYDSDMRVEFKSDGSYRYIGSDGLDMNQVGAYSVNKDILTISSSSIPYDFFTFQTSFGIAEEDKFTIEIEGNKMLLSYDVGEEEMVHTFYKVE